MTALPLFPLNMVLFPGGKLSLQIFEVRYLDMVQQCLANQTTFGIVMLTSGSEVRLPGKTETFSQVGTLVHIDEWSSPRKGIINLLLTGTRRFTIYTIQQQPHGLWIADNISMIDNDKAISIPEELMDTSLSLEDLVTSTKQQGIAESELAITPPFLWNDCGWVANRWAELLPFTLEERQNLLTLDNPVLRLELIQDELIERGLIL